MAQGGVVKHVEQGGRHLGAAPHKQGAFRVGGLRPGGEAMAYQHMTRPPAETGEPFGPAGPSCTALSPQGAVSQKFPGLGRVEIGQRKQLQKKSVLLYGDRGEGVGKLCGEIDPAAGQGGFEESPCVRRRRGCRR